MMTLFCDDSSTLNSLKLCYANKLNTRSLKARYKANADKKKFKAKFLESAEKTGTVVDGAAIIVMEFNLPRCDWDAPIKALQDSIQETVFSGKDDRVVRQAYTVLTRPSKKHDAFIRIHVYSATTEWHEFLIKVQSLCATHAP